MQNEGLFQKRIKKARVIASLLGAMPFVRMVGLNGSMTKGTMHRDSDIDFLIIATHGRIWTARFFTILLTILIGQRESPGRSAGKTCLNRYQTDQFLEIMPHNQYHAETFAPLVPLYDNNIYLNYQKTNDWTIEFGFKVKPSIKITLNHNPLLKILQKFGEFILTDHFGNYFEKVLRNYQIKIIKQNKAMQKASKGRVRISDWELCFHPKKE